MAELYAGQDGLSIHGTDDTQACASQVSHMSIVYIPVAYSAFGTRHVVLWGESCRHWLRACKRPLVALGACLRVRTDSAFAASKS